ncbi:MAG: hypothetical protein COA96_12890 [SAR86 cluster bacterium]|uniref:Uncharacterized protein n=1 Tax=SAR86 cluster bacterium TaxID=2030880 RepID=A0A2A5AUU0_9GAMM|nr:MAG: hypothetical protein COA96_12890 [SAR86 cluster bacterium]
MKKIFKWLAAIVVSIIVLIGLFLFSMRFHDGPLEILSGGPFKTGDLVSAPQDWSYLKNRATIEFQTMEPMQSRTVWLAVHDQRLFVVSGYMTTNYGAIWKKWPHYLENDDRIILRIDGELYEQRLQRILSGPEVIPVLDEFVRKYGAGEPGSDDSVSTGDTWMYEVVNRN